MQLMDRMETYGFDCEATSLAMCRDWLALRSALTQANERAERLRAALESAAQVWDRNAIEAEENIEPGSFVRYYREQADVIRAAAIRALTTEGT